ncbi:MAG: hypothetical protein WBD40_13990 [Tepidisphaeraceae bacterium]
MLPAHGFSPKKDLLAQLLELNLAVAAREKAGEAVDRPGRPSGYGDPAKLVTDDSIKPRAPQSAQPADRARLS